MTELPDRGGTCALLLRSALLVLAAAVPAVAYEHHDSRVDFQDWADDVVERNLAQQRPYFLLFSAEWCHWCHEFEKHALSRKEVYGYLNEHFVNVFIDADIHNAAYARYRATGLPYVVFLKPDGSIHFRYSGTIYADQFVEVLQDIRKTIDEGLSIPGQDIELDPYVPPETLEVAELIALSRGFSEGIVENFDPREHGVGRGEKAILPRTFLYLLEHAQDQEREAVIEGVGKALDRAIETIYDPVEGGFFRYAETRDWRVPHYEKMADLNAGAVLVLHRLGELSSSAERAGAGTRTTEYLQSTLFEPRLGTFLSFQGADTRYFRLDAAGREAARAPLIADKVFTDRLAATLDHLLDVLPHAGDPMLEGQVLGSLEFLASMAAGQDRLRRYHLPADGTWHGDSLPRDYALVARVFQKAARRLSEPRYARISHGVVESAISRFYEPERGIFVDPSFAGDDSIEYLMETNALLALAMMRLDEDGLPQRWDVVESLMTYFSGVGELLDERLWESTEWEIMEAYVPYLEAIDAWLALGSERS
ncbi:MAG: DUF255 domain-containing protein [Gammaproteobacteria bacterium]|nr:DUF255 domain-containing protein [Gammaproteobacteria bacterium]